VEEGRLILAAGALLALGLVASLLAGRLRVPGLLLVLGLGMAFGTDGTGWIHFGSEFEDYELARMIGILALSLILFEGGLNAGWGEIRPVLGPAVSLALLGTVLTAIVTGLVATWLFGLSTIEGLLVGSILAATDGAAIFALLRDSTLRRRLARTLEGEAGLNDAVAVLLVVGFIGWITEPGYGLQEMAVLFVSQIVLGVGVGMGVGWLAVKAFRRARLPTAGLYPVASVAAAAVAYGGADTLGGSGFVAVYLTGLWLGSAAIPARRTVTSFHQGLAWVAQLAMFFVLGLLVFPSQLPPIAAEGTVLALALVFLARPVAAAASTAFAGYSTRERAVLSWAGLRGAVPVVLATFPVIEEVPDSLGFFNIVFFAVLLSTLVQGATFEPIARLLGVTTNEPALPQPLAETGTIRRLGAEIVEYPVSVDDAIVGHPVRDLGLPREALLNVIVRGDQAIPPRGSTRVLAGDRLHVLVRQEVARDFEPLLERWRSGPIGAPVRARTTPRSSKAISVVRPWTDGDGDPGRPATVLGVDAVEHLRSRRDRPGALVALADGRYAFTGPIMAVGPRASVQAAARKRMRAARTDAERAWWEEVIGAMAR
jgi:cell volume regulation protein A